MKDVTKRDITEKILQTQSTLIDFISKSTPLNLIFEFITEAISDIFYGKYISCIITYDKQNRKVVKCISNNLDKDLILLQENLILEEGNGSHIHSYISNHSIIVEDISTSIEFKNVKEIFIDHEIKSVISFPIIDKNGFCIATLNIYQKNQTQFKKRDLEYLNKLLDIIKIAVENQTKENEKQKLSQIVEKASNLIIISNESGYITWINESVTKLTGYKFNELVGQHIFDFPNVKKYNSEVIKYIQESINKLEVYDVEIYNVSKYGVTYWVEVNGTPYFNDEGKFSGYIQIENDITKRKESDIRLETSEKLLSSITSNITEGIYRSTPDKGILYSNNAFIQLFGFKDLNEVMNIEIASLYANKKERDLLKIKLEKKGVLINEEVLFKRKDGSTFWGSLNSKCVVDENKQIYYDGVIKDITYKRDSEEKLKKYNAQLENIMNALNISSYVSMTDKEGKIIFVNDKFCDVSGYSREFILGKDHNLLNSGYHSKEFWDNMWDTINEGKSWRGDIKNRNKLGTYFWMDTVINPIKNENGEIYRYLSIRNDITDRKIAENEVIRLNESLEQKVIERTSLLNDALEEVRMLNTTLYEANQNLTSLNEEKSEFMGIAAHDLKNPIQGIMFAAELVKTHIDKVSTQQILYNMDFIEKTATRMRDIINNFLSANAIETGKLTLSYENYNINQILDDLVTNYIPVAEKKQVIIKYVSTDVYTKIDKNAFIQICENLISNAIKFSPHNKKVEITLEATEDRYFVYFKDEGPGLTFEDRKKLFKKYAKLSAKPTGGENSTGLGLSIVKKLVEIMNGKIECISEEGNGATFFIDMPVRKY